MSVGADLANAGTHVEFRKDAAASTRPVQQGFPRAHTLVSGAALPFKSADGVVGVYSYDESATESFGRAKVTHMTNMQQIEIAVRKR